MTQSVSYGALDFIITMQSHGVREWESLWMYMDDRAYIMKRPLHSGDDSSSRTATAKVSFAIFTDK